MKSVIRLFKVIVLCCVSLQAYTQGNVLRIGANFSGMKLKYDIALSDDIQYKTGFFLGAFREFPVSEKISLETGLVLSTAGYKQEIPQGGPLDFTDIKYRINLYYLNIPINARMGFDLGNRKIYGFLGPYCGVGIYGRSKDSHLFRGQPYSGKTDIRWGNNSDTDDFRRFDFGISAGSEIELGSIRAGISYTFGLANIASKNPIGKEAYNRVITISLGYKL